MYTALYMASTRTQIYLTDGQKRRLDELSRNRGRSMASLIREAVDAYVADSGPDAGAALADTYGTLPGLHLPDRAEWDRG